MLAYFYVAYILFVIQIIARALSLYSSQRCFLVIDKEFLYKIQLFFRPHKDDIFSV